MPKTMTYKQDCKAIELIIANGVNDNNYLIASEYKRIAGVDNKFRKYNEKLENVLDTYQQKFSENFPLDMIATQIHIEQPNFHAIKNAQRRSKIALAIFPSIQDVAEADYTIKIEHNSRKKEKKHCTAYERKMQMLGNVYSYINFVIMKKPTSVKGLCLWENSLTITRKKG